MAAPSKNFTVIADSAIDADSPITADLMEDFRDNDIHLEEWLGKDYTAAQNHDHDGTNSARITLSAYTAQHTDVCDSDLEIDTGSLGFDPQAVMIHWVTAMSSDYQYYGWGMGSGLSDQCGMSCSIYMPATTPNWEYLSIDSDSIIGFNSEPGGSGILNTSFAEYADITSFDSSGVVIETQTGSWGGQNGYFNVQVWGS